MVDLTESFGEGTDGMSHRGVCMCVRVCVLPFFRVSTYVRPDGRTRQERGKPGQEVWSRHTSALPHRFISITYVSVGHKLHSPHIAGSPLTPCNNCAIDKEQLPTCWVSPLPLRGRPTRANTCQKQQRSCCPVTSAPASCAPLKPSSFFG